MESEESAYKLEHLVSFKKQGLAKKRLFPGKNHNDQDNCHCGR